MTASKFHDDIFILNSDFAIIGGVTVEELNIMEYEFLSLIGFDLYIKEEDYYNYCAKLQKFAAKKLSENNFS